MMVGHERYPVSLWGRIGLVLVALMLAGAADARHPLEPLDTSSPRATMDSFPVLTDQVARRLVEYRAAPSPATIDAHMVIDKRLSPSMPLSSGDAAHG